MSIMRDFHTERYNQPSGDQMSIMRDFHTERYNQPSGDQMLRNKSVTFSGLFTVPYFRRSFGINLSMGDNTCLR